MRDETKNENLPTIIISDGFDDVDVAENRLIQGTIIRCVDGVWTARDGTTPPTKLIALATATALQKWEGGLPVETIVKTAGQPWPDLDELNSRIPQKQWEKGLNNELRPPWCRQHICYLLNPLDAGMFTFINSTVGAAIAVSRLKDRVQWMRRLRGAHVVPLIKLDAKAMKTKFGVKQRPEFTVIEWRDFSGGLTTTAPAIEHLGQPVEPPSVEEELNDSVKDI